MLTQTFIYYTICYIVLLLILDIPFMIAFIGFTNPHDDKIYDTQWLGFQWMINVVCLIVYAFAAWIFGMIMDIDSHELSFFGTYFKSPLSLFIILTNTIMIVILCGVVLNATGYLLAFKLANAEIKGGNIKACRMRIEEEIKNIELQLKTTKDPHAKDSLYSSKKSFETELSTYQVMERANSDLQAVLTLKLHNLNCNTDEINNMVKNVKS